MKKLTIILMLFLGCLSLSAQVTEKTLVNVTNAVYDDSTGVFLHARVERINYIADTLPTQVLTYNQIKRARETAIADLALQQAAYTSLKNIVKANVNKYKVNGRYTPYTLQLQTQYKAAIRQSKKSLMELNKVWTTFEGLK